MEVLGKHKVTFLSIGIGTYLPRCDPQLVAFAAGSPKWENNVG